MHSALFTNLYACEEKIVKRDGDVRLVVKLRYHKDELGPKDRRRLLGEYYSVDPDAKVHSAFSGNGLDTGHKTRTIEHLELSLDRHNPVVSAYSFTLTIDGLDKIADARQKTCALSQAANLPENMRPAKRSNRVVGATNGLEPVLYQIMAQSFLKTHHHDGECVKNDCRQSFEFSGPSIDRMADFINREITIGFIARRLIPKSSQLMPIVGQTGLFAKEARMKLYAKVLGDSSICINFHFDKSQSKHVVTSAAELANWLNLRKPMFGETAAKPTI